MAFRSYSDFDCPEPREKKNINYGVLNLGTEGESRCLNITNSISIIYFFKIPQIKTTKSINNNVKYKFNLKKIIFNTYNSHPKT